MQQAFHLSAIGAAGAGISGWQQLRQLLERSSEYVPDAPEANTTLLSAAEKRRASALTRLVLAAAEQACPTPPPKLGAVFVSNTGDSATTHAICESLAAPEPSVSPTRFTNSVHNAPAAYWSIALRNPTATTSIAAGETGFSAGLIEASQVMCRYDAPVLLLAYDAPYPGPLAGQVPVRQPLALALLLSRTGPGPGWLMRLGNEPAESLPAPLSPHFDRHTCSAGLIWLAAQVHNSNNRSVLPYLDQLTLVLEPTDA